jgi:hypothetical protein
MFHKVKIEKPVCLPRRDVLDQQHSLAVLGTALLALAINQSDEVDWLLVNTDFLKRRGADDDTIIAAFKMLSQ